MAPIKTRKITVKVRHGQNVAKDGDAEKFTIEVNADGSQSIHDIKQLIAQAAGGQMAPEHLFLTFSPNERKIGRQFAGDPAIDEHKLLLREFSILQWLEKFPHWSLTARLIPGTPPPPGVAIQRAAAIAEQKDPDRAVQDARAKGEIPKINELPAPWGPAPETGTASETELVSAGYLPAKYPESSSPLVVN